LDAAGGVDRRGGGFPAALLLFADRRGTGPVMGPTTAIVMSWALTGAAAKANASPVNDRINALCMFTPPYSLAASYERSRFLAEARDARSFRHVRRDETLFRFAHWRLLAIDRPMSASGRVRAMPWTKLRSGRSAARRSA